MSKKLAADIKWFEVQAYSGSSNLWAFLEWQGYDSRDWEGIDPDSPRGRQSPWHDGGINDLIADGRFEEVDVQFWYKQSGSGKKLRDLVWTGGRSIVASAGFIETLRSIRATGWVAKETELRLKNGDVLTGWWSFAATSTSDTDDIRCLLNQPNFAFRMKPHVLEALRAAGHADFESGVFNSSVYEEL